MIGTVRVACSNGPTVALPWAKMTSGFSAVNSAACLRISPALPGPSEFRSARYRWSNLLVLAPAENRRNVPEIAVIRGQVHEHANAPHLVGLLRACCKGQKRRAAKKRNELAPPHSITSSALVSSAGGMGRPSAFAVLRLKTSSNLVGCTTGRFAGFSPLRMRPA